MGKFASTLRRGFHMSFDNGLTVSVQWGAGNYCDNHDDLDFSCTKDAHSTTAEVAVFITESGEFINARKFISNGDNNDEEKVIGWLSPEEVVELMTNVKNSKLDEVM